MAHLFTSALLFPFILFFMSFTSSSVSDHLSSSFVPTYTYWSQNVNNKMPTLISSKLSPLTKQESDYYTKIISQKNFRADSNFCSLAKLACSTKIDKSIVSHLLSRNQYGYGNKGLMPLDSNVDPFSFFRSSILKEKNTIHLPNLKESVSFRSFLPPQIASKFSLTTDQLTKIFPLSSKEDIDITISTCNSEMKGETKACLKSLEEMISFSKNTLGTSKVLALNSISTIGSTKLVTIKKIKQFNVEKIVACHEMFLPFSTYLCHSVSSSRIYSVELVEPKSGTPVSTAIAVCHMDTSDWSEHHVAFKILTVGPGQSEACHWVNENGLAWVASEKNI